MGCSCAVRGVCGRQEARAGARGAGSAQKRRAHEPTRPRPDNTRRAGDDARPGAAPAPHSPGRQALESALPRAAPPTDLAGDGVSTRPRALCRPRPPTGNREATRGDRAQLQKGRIELGRALQAWSPIKLGGGHLDCTHTSFAGCKGEGPTRAHDPLSKLGHLWVGAPREPAGLRE